MKGTAIWIYASAGLMALGAFGPWVTVLTRSVSGIDGTNDGWAVLALAALAALIFYTRGHRSAGMLVVLVLGLVGLGLTIYDRTHIQHIIDSGGDLIQVTASVGWGLNLAMLASGSLTIAALTQIFRKPAVEAVDTTSPA